MARRKRIWGFCSAMMTTTPVSKTGLMNFKLTIMRKLRKKRRISMQKRAKRSKVKILKITHSQGAVC